MFPEVTGFPKLFDPTGEIFQRPARATAIAPLGLVFGSYVPGFTIETTREKLKLLKDFKVTTRLLSKDCGHGRMTGGG